MTDFTIPDQLAERLEDIAKRENRPVDEIVEEALQQYAEDHLPPAPPTRNLLLLIAQAADELGEGSKEGDIAERSRELLDTEFPDYSMRRMRGQQ